MYIAPTATHMSMMRTMMQNNADGLPFTIAIILRRLGDLIALKAFPSCTLAKAETNADKRIRITIGINPFVLPISGSVRNPMPIIEQERVSSEELNPPALIDVHLSFSRLIPVDELLSPVDRCLLGGESSAA